MAERLTLSRTGIKSPLDIGAPPETPADPPAPASPKPATAPTPKTATPRRPRARPSASTPKVTATTTVELTPPPAHVTRPMPGDGLGGYPIQTSIQFDLELFQRAEALARDAGVSLTSLLLAALGQDLPTDPTAGAELAVSERVDHADAIRIERNLRMARDLRTRLDGLVAPYERSLRGARSLLINAVLRQQLPDSAEAAKALTQAHIRRQTLAALHLNS